MDLAGLAHRYIEALNRGDVDAIMDLYAQDATVEDPVGGAVITGTEAIRAFYTSALRAPFDARLSGPARVAGNEVVFPFHLEIAKMGMAIDIIDGFVVGQDGRVVSMRAWWGPGNMTRLDRPQ